MRRFLLEQESGSPGIEIPAQGWVVLGRGYECDVQVAAETVSTRHARLRVDDDRLLIEDLDSRNGVRVNGQRVTSGAAKNGDLIQLGQARFVLRIGSREGGGEPGGALPTLLAESEVPSPSALRQRLDTLAVAPRRPGHVSLDLLLGVFDELSTRRDLSSLLERITEVARMVADADVAALRVEPPRKDDPHPIVVSRNGLAREPGSIPTSIVRHCVQTGRALLSENAGEDHRLGASVIEAKVRTAIGVPLVDDDHEVLGVLYVDRRGNSPPFRGEDLDLMIRYSGIASLTLRNLRLGQRLARELATRANLERFFSPRLVERMASKESQLRPGGQQQPAVVLFSDIRNFTAFAESQEARAMMEQLNEYFTAMVDVVFEHDGTLDKFIGDAVMAVWGAPEPQPDAAGRAVQAAQQMLEQLERLNAGWIARGCPPLGIGIGINEGPVFSGYVGSPRRLEYTVMGDAVNVASRLCSVAAAGEVVVGASLQSVLSGPPFSTTLDTLQLAVKGRAEPVRACRWRPTLAPPPLDRST